MSVIQVLVIVGILIVGIVSRVMKHDEEEAPTQPEEAVRPQHAAPKPRKPSPRPVVEGERTTSSMTDVAPEETPAADSEFAINSAEEARRAIILGEILQRKY